MSEEAGAKAKKEKKIPDGVVIPPKKPKLSKAERRALQEQQRAAKVNQQGQGKDQITKQVPPPKQQPKQQHQQKQEKGEGKINHGQSAGGLGQKQHAPKEVSSGSAKSSLVTTLPVYRDPFKVFHTGGSLQPRKTNKGAPTSASSSSSPLHQAVIALGYKYATGEIRGGNARCRRMLACFEIVLNDFEPPSKDPSVDFRHVVDQQILKASFQFWTEQCRPHSVSMGNAFTVLKAAVASLDRRLSYEEMRSIVLDAIQAYCRERIEYADRAIADLACQKLFSSGASEWNPEVILTYGYSEVVDMTLRQAAVAGKTNFRVIVVDCQPLLEGRRLLTQLRDAGIECTYVLLSALTYVLQDVDKVLLGASALMSDGSIWGRAGTGCVALAAHAQHIPVLVCSETHKISPRVQLESLTTNELGSPFEQATELSNENQIADEGRAEGKLPPNLKHLNLLYDLTPAAFVSGIVTELGIIPPTSVAVLLRELNQVQG